MKRHTVLAAAVVPVLTLTIAVTAQAATPADTPSDPAASETSDASTAPIQEPAETELGDPSESASPDPAETTSDEPTASTHDEPASPPEDALPTDPAADAAEVELPAAVSPSAASAIPPAPSSSAPADVLITLAASDVVPDAVLVSGYVVGVESGGTCTLTLTREGEVRSISEAAEPDAATTVCGGLTMSTETLAPGEWSATVTYTSTTRAGTSEPTVVVVQ